MYICNFLALSPSFLFCRPKLWFYPSLIVQRTDKRLGIKRLPVPFQSRSKQLLRETQGARGTMTLLSTQLGAKTRFFSDLSTWKMFDTYWSNEVAPSRWSRCSRYGRQRRRSREEGRDQGSVNTDLVVEREKEDWRMRATENCFGAGPAAKLILLGLDWFENFRQ